jgi:uracil phosphoribosyltransferase
MCNIILKAKELDGYLTDEDNRVLAELERKFIATDTGDKEQLITTYNELGNIMKDYCKSKKHIKVYPFEMPHESHAEVSRIIAKLRNKYTNQQEFIYYTQRSYELLFKLAYSSIETNNKNYLVVETPVDYPFQNQAVHKIVNIDKKINNTVMCVMLRGALLPSIIMSKEIQEYSSNGYITPFALFKISRDDARKESNMEYTLNLDKSFFNIQDLNGKDVIFADPMNATGGSLITIIDYIKSQGVKPKSVLFFNVIASLKGALRVTQAVEDCTVYTLWMDPCLNENAYICPGVGDYGDRCNGIDTKSQLIELIANYGTAIVGLYRKQIKEIDNVIAKGHAK